MSERIQEALAVRPSPRQLAWQQLEFYGFIHFGMNTMTDREWGTGTEDPSLFDPVALDADQWVAGLISAGMRAVILTCKHHDGFALWPTAVSSHSVASSPWRDGNGDVVHEVADACRRHGLKFGIYLSPWDRAEASYGSGQDYDDFFVAQLTELLTGYGDIFCVWFDGANGEGPNGRVQLYDWDRYYSVVRQLQPGAVISVCGPDVRWCGNEAGATRPDEWSVVPAALRDAERTADRSQKIDDSAFASLIRSDDTDLGSREALESSTGPLAWYPAEVNTSIRPGWFHHPSEDDAVRSADELFSIYLHSVGGNATFLLNVPPTRDGLIADPDLRVLDDLGRRIGALHHADIVEDARIVLSSTSRDNRDSTQHPAGGAWRDRIGSWTPSPSDPTPAVIFSWEEPQTVWAVVVKEDITAGQLIEHITITSTGSGSLVHLAEAGCVGYERIVTFDPVLTDNITITVDRSRAPAHLADLRVLTR